MKRRIFINRYFYPDHSATSQLLTDLAFEMAREPGRVMVITSRQRYDDPDAEMAAAETVNGVDIRRVWTSRFGRGRLLGRAFDYLTFYLSAAWNLLLLARRGDVIIAKTDPPLLSVIAAVIAKLKGAVLVNWVQDMFPEVASELGVKGLRHVEPLLRRLRNLSFDAARVNVALGDRMADRIIREGIQPAKVAVIHNWSGIPAEAATAPGENPIRTQWDLNGKFIVGYSGNMGRAHDFATIIDAATLLRNERHITFLFIGGGAGEEWIRGQVRERGLGNVLFKPYQNRERLSETLSLPDVHLITLRPELEGLIVPSKFYGIAEVGRATVFVGDPSGEIPKILNQERCGFVVEDGDAAGLASRIKWLAENRGELAACGLRARNVFRRRFDRRIALARWKELLELA